MTMKIDKLFTSSAYKDWLTACARRHDGYWYGVPWQKATKSLYHAKRKQYPAHYGDKRAEQYERDIANARMVGDCVNGAIKGAVWSELGSHKLVYASNGCPDKSADGLFNYLCGFCEHGVMSELPDEAGIFLHKSGHAGVTIGGGYAVEFRGFAYGCCTTRIAGRGWTGWVRLPWVQYESEAEVNNERIKFVTTGCLYIRAKPNISSCVKGVLKKGVSITGRRIVNEKWLEFEYNNCICYASTKFMRKVD